MSYLANLAEFGGKFEETNRESLSKEEIKGIKSIEIVERHSQEGEPFLCMCFHMKSGKQKSAYLSKKSDLEVGDQVDPKSVEFITLERGDEVTVKADGTAL